MRHFFGFICVLALAVMGCGGAPDSGEGCKTVGLEACDGAQPLRCSQDEVWTEIGGLCLAPQTCVSQDGNAACIDVYCANHANLCFDLQQSECDGTVLRRCQGPEDCPIWTDVEDCAASGLVCEDGVSPALCLPPGELPYIIEVKWVWSDPCSYMAASDVTITTTAIPADLRYEGSVTDCTGDIGGAVAVLTCENLTLMAGSVTVTDSRTNNEASVSFAFDACVDGRVCADGEPCCNESTLRCSESDPSVIEQCAADGNWVLSETCGEGYLCDVHASIAVCHAAECVDLDRRCFESDDLPGTDVEYCQNGTWLLADSCQRLKPDGWVCREDTSTVPPTYYCAAGP